MGFRSGGPDFRFLLPGALLRRSRAAHAEGLRMDHDLDRVLLLMLEDINSLFIFLKREGMCDQLFALDRAGREEVQHFLGDVQGFALEPTMRISLKLTVLTGIKTSGSW